MSNELPMINPVPMIDTTKKKSSCFLLTLPGCLISSCVGLVAFCCFITIGPCVGLGAIAAIVYSNGVSRQDSQAFPLESGEMVSLHIDDIKTEVNLTGGTGNEIRFDYDLTVYGFSEGQAKGNLENTQVIFDRAADGTFTLKVDGGDTAFHIYDLTLNITAPPDRFNEILITTDEPVTIQNVTGNFVIKGSDSEQISLTNVKGSYNISNTLGNIEVSGEIDRKSQNVISTTSGDISIRLQGSPDLTYSATVGSLGTLTCPNPAPGSRSCVGRLGDATANLTVNSNSGTVTLIANR